MTLSWSSVVVFSAIPHLSISSMHASALSLTSHVTGTVRSWPGASRRSSSRFREAVSRTKGHMCQAPSTLSRISLFPRSITALVFFLRNVMPRIRSYAISCITSAAHLSVFLPNRRVIFVSPAIRAYESSPNLTCLLELRMWSPCSSATLRGMNTEPAPVSINAARSSAPDARCTFMQGVGHVKSSWSGSSGPSSASSVSFMWVQANLSLVSCSAPSSSGWFLVQCRCSKWASIFWRVSSLSGSVPRASSVLFIVVSPSTSVVLPKRVMMALWSLP